MPDPHNFSGFIISYPMAYYKSLFTKIENSKLPANGYDRIIREKTRQS